MGHESHSSIGISFGPSSFIEAVGDRALEVILPDMSQDGTGIQYQVAAGYNLFFEKCSHQLGADVLQHSMRYAPEESREPFQGRWGSIGIESYCLADGGIVLEFEGQIRKGLETP